MMQFCKIDRKECKVTQPVTRELFYETVRNEQVSQVINQLAATTDPEERKNLKGQLPAFFFMAQWVEGGVRPTRETSVPTGLCMHDFDHLPEDPRTIYNNKVKPLHHQIGDLLAHITPSQQGLRLVTPMLPGETPAECQIRVAVALGLEKYRDEHVKDISHMSFAVPESFLLHVDDALFNLENSNVVQGVVTDVPETENKCQDMQDVAEDAVFEEINGESSETSTAQPCGMYRDCIPHTRIVQELIRRRANNGQVKEGQRNDLLYFTARELRPVVGCNFQYIYDLLKPVFLQKGFADSEIRATIGRALGSAGAYIKHPSPLMKNILNELLVEYGKPDEYHMRPLPWLPKAIRDLQSLAPENLAEAVFLGVLPMLGTLGTAVRFEYEDGKVHSLSFLAHIVAPPASNKSVAAHIFEVVMKKIVEMDDAARAMDEKERQLRQANQNTNEKMIYTSRPIRILPARVTAAVLYKRLNDAKGLHLFLTTEELSGLIRALGGQYGGFQETLCKAFDNARDGKETLDDRTPNFNGPVYLNTLTCGTPKVTNQFFGNPEDGMAMRFIPIILPDNLAEDMPKYKQPTAAQQKRIDQMIDDLMNEGQADIEEIQEDGASTELAVVKTGSVSGRGKKANGRKVYTFPVLNAAIKKWLDESKQEFLENQDAVWRRLAFRSAVIGFRAAVAMWVVMGKPAMNNPNSLSAQRLVDIMLWVADYVRMAQYSLFAKRMDEQLNEHMIVERTGKNKLLLSLLGKEFTLNDVISVGLQQSRDISYDSACQMASRWCKAGEVVRVEDGRYRKAA